MKWIDIIAQAFSNLMRRKLRSGLTMLGVVIGTAAIVVTVSLGYGAEAAQMEAIESMSNLRLVSVSPYVGAGSSSATTNRITKINDSVINRIREIPGVDAVTPVVYAYLGADSYLTTGKLEVYAPIIAVNPKDFAKIQGLREGKYFSGNTSQMEFIMSEMYMMEFRDPKKEDEEMVDIWEYMMAGEDLPLPHVNWLRAKFTMQFRWEKELDESADYDAEPEIETMDVKARMVGYTKASLDEYLFSYGAVVNLEWLKRFQRENKAWIKDQGGTPVENYDTVQVLANSVDSVVEITRSLKELGVQAYSELSYIEQMRSQIRTMQGFLGFIGMISMLVAALSIANTMMMSIYERTREIGVMKVLGCKLGNIRLMFLSEAAFIGLIGGGLGLIASYGLSYALNNVEALRDILSTVMSSDGGQFGSTSAMSIIPAYLALGTWAGVALISVLSGVQPAQRAMKLSSLAAIRSAD